MPRSLALLPLVLLLAGAPRATGAQSPVDSALAAYIASRRVRYFGNTAPLITGAVASGSR